MVWRLPTIVESPLLYTCELWVFAMCPALRGSTVSYAGVAHFTKHSLEYSLDFWSQSKKKKRSKSWTVCGGGLGDCFSFTLMDQLCGSASHRIMLFKRRLGCGARR